MDDTQDKARRNLVFFCSIVLFCGLLGIDEIGLVTRVFGGSSGVVAGVSKMRIVLVALATLVYLSLRYRFSDAFIQFLDSIKGEWDGDVKIQVIKIINSHLQNMANKDVHSKILNLNLRELLSDTVFHKINHFDEKINYKVKARNFGFRSFDEGSFSFEFQAVEKLGIMVYSSSGDPVLQYKLDNLNKFAVLLKVILLKCCYSKTSVEHVVPLVLAFLTVVLLILRVGVLLQ